MTDVPDNDDDNQEPVGDDIEDGHVNPLTDEVYDAQAGEYRGSGEEPVRFTDAQFDELQEFFRGLVAQRVEYPMGELLNPVNRALDTIMGSVAYHSVARLKQLESLVRGLMRNDLRDHGPISEGGMSPYVSEAVRAFSVKPYLDAADRLRRDINARRRRRSQAQNSRGQRRQQANPGVMSVNEMVDSDSPFLVCVGLLLMRRAGRVWWDEFQKNYFTDWDGSNNDAVVPIKPITDDVMLAIKAWLIPHSRTLSKLGTQTVTEAVMHVAKMDVRNELTDWLNSLRWDGTERLKAMAKEIFGIEGNDYAVRAVMNMMVSAVARAMNPGCQMSSMLVIRSPQDMGKSKLIRILAGDRWYREVVAKPTDKDFVVNMTGGWLLEVAELASIAKHGTDDASVKDAISRATDYIRPPYGRTTQEYKRSSIFIGTTNDSHWHRDVTGGKRWWPITALKVDLDWAKANREQLWAEAVKAYLDGYAYWEVPLEAHAEALNEVAQYDPVEDDVDSRLMEGLRSGALYGGLLDHPNVLPMSGTNRDGTTEEERFGNLVTLQRVGVWWMGIAIDQINRRQHDVRRLLTTVGWVDQRVRAGGKQHRAWLPGPKALARYRETGSVSTSSDPWNLIPEQE